ncbi:hypothetical protein HJC23_000991 [Cyclotella cryptica]|uniref:Uncharacterized protein n=1 Tax=Cyclotella cryptica TaxID=29204 RepID=A0ABD3P1P8_9STRA|eukprot:CCRYP_018461-RA/>CCRYP_018461-RA protein AED:0.00 eAED:0.00 QI:72/-1/1/1/-1/1/1/96/400
MHGSETGPLARDTFSNKKQEHQHILSITMAPTPSSLLSTALLSQILLQPVSPLSITPLSSSSSHVRQSKLFPVPPSTPRSPHWQNRIKSTAAPSTTPLRAQSFAQNPWGFLPFPDLFRVISSHGYGIDADDAQASLLSLEGGVDFEESKVTPVRLEKEEVANAMLSVEQSMDEQRLLSEIHSLTQTFDNLQSSINSKSQVYTETLEAYQANLSNMQEENSFLQEGMRMLTISLEEQANEIQTLHDENDKVREENEMLRRRVRGLEVELSDFAFESRKVVRDPVVVEHSLVSEVVDAEGSVHDSVEERSALTIPVDEDQDAEEVVDLTPKAPTAPIPHHIQQQRQLEQLQRKLQAYEEERSSLRKLLGLCFRKGVREVGKAVNLWRPVYLLLVDAKKGALA